MKHLFILALLCVASCLAYAQDTQDYQLFRPEVQYLYDNSAANPFNQLFEAPGSDYLGVKLYGENLTADGRYLLYQMPVLSDASACYFLRPSIAGTSIAVTPASTTMYFETEDDAPSLLIVHSAPVDSTWAATPGITGRVDSITDGSFLERGTMVKHLSFLDSGSGEVLATITIGQDIGLLSAVDFFRLGREDLWFSALVSTSAPALGPQLPSTDEIFNVPIGTVLSTSEVRSVVLPAIFWYEHTDRNMVVNEVLWDTVNQIQEITVTYDENLYRIAPNDGDSVYNARRTFNQRAKLSTPFYTIDALRAQPGAAIVTENDFGRTLQLSRAGNLSQSCFDIGRGVQYLGDNNRQQVTNCFSPPTDNAPGGLYFRHATGPYGYMGSFSFFERGLHQVRNATSDCGGPLDLTVATRSFQPDERIRLYPNPATEQVAVEIPTDLGTVNVQIFDLGGRLQTAFIRGGEHQRIDVSALPTGVYLVVVSGKFGLLGRRRLVVR